MVNTTPTMPRRACLSLAIAIWLAGCAQAPTYQQPPLPDTAAFTAGAALTATVATEGPLGQGQQVVDGPIDAAWWRSLGSTALDGLVDDALRASPTLAAADAALRQAQEVFAAQSGATRLPQVDLGLGAQRQQISPSSQGLQGDTREFGLYSASVGVRYRFDFGGGTNSSL